MTYAHLTTNDLVMIEAYYQENIKSFRYCDFTWQIKTDNLQCHQLYERGALCYKINKKRCGRNKTSLAQSEIDFIQTHLEQN